MTVAALITALQAISNQNAPVTSLDSDTDRRYDINGATLDTNGVCILSDTLVMDDNVAT